MSLLERIIIERNIDNCLLNPKNPNISAEFIIRYFRKFKEHKYKLYERFRKNKKIMKLYFGKTAPYESDKVNESDKVSESDDSSESNKSAEPSSEEYIYKYINNRTVEYLCDNSNISYEILAYITARYYFNDWCFVKISENTFKKRGYKKAVRI